MSEILAINYSPIRIGFLVNKGSVEEVIKSAQLNTIFIGGGFNPIIPIDDGDNLFAKKLVKIFRVDIFFSISKKPDVINNFVKDYSYLNAPFNLSRPLFKFVKYHETKFLDISTLLEQYNKDLKGVENFKSRFALVNWEDNDRHSNIFNLIYGKYPDNYNFKFDFKKAYDLWLKSSKFNIDSKPNSIIEPYIEKGYITPLVFTCNDLYSIRNNLMILDEGFYLGDVNCFDDLVNFWNLRALSLNVNFIPIDGIKRFRKIIRENHQFLSEIKKISSFATDQAIFYKGDSDKLKKLKNTVKELIDYRGIDLGDILYWDNFLEGWHSVYFNKVSQPVVANLESSKDNKVKLRFNLPEKLISSRNYYKHDVDYYINDQYINVIIDSEHISELNNFTLNFPCNRELNRLIGEKVYPFEPNALRLTEEGFKIMINCKRNILDIYEINKEDLINDLFKYAEMKISLSSPGYKIKLIISKLGSLMNCGIFKLNNLRDLFSGLIQMNENEEDRVQNLGQILKIEKIYEYIGRDVKECSLKKLSQNLNIEVNSIFNFLIENELLLGGYSVKCPNCNISYWIPIPRIDSNIRCDYCTENFKLINSLYDKKGEFSYRVNGIFSRRERDEGSIVSILTTLQLYKFLSINSKDIYIMPSINVKDENIDCEIDLSLITIGYNREINILIGECKNNNEINEKDILNLIAIKDKFKEKKINTAFIFSKCGENFSDNEKKLFNVLIEDGNNIITLSKKELTSEEIYSNYKKEELKDTSHTLESVFRNSKFFLQRH